MSGEPARAWRNLYQHYRELVCGHIAELTGTENRGDITGAMVDITKLVHDLREENESLRRALTKKG